VRGTTTSDGPQVAATGRAGVVDAVRLFIVPLALSASVVAGDDAIADVQLLVVAAILQLYATTVWVAGRRRVRLARRWLSVLDVGLVLTFMTAADVSASAAGRLPLLIVLCTWAFLIGPRDLVIRGALFTSAVVVLHVAVVDHWRWELEDARFVLYGVLASIVFAVIAARVQQREVHIDALERRTHELLAEGRDLERRERQRIAQLLHDDALQRLLAARQDLDQGAGGDDAESLRRAMDGLAEATRSLRSLTHVVHDDALTAAGLEAAVRRVAEDAALRSRLDARVVVTAGISQEAAPILIGIVRELVSNVERHARASTLHVELLQRPDGPVVEVRDDGCGMTSSDLAEAERAGHLGHASLRRRVEDLRGVLEVDATPGHGSRVRVSLPDREIEAQRAIEVALRNEREWNAALVAGFPDPFIVTTVDRRLVDVSDRFVAVTGWSRAELLAAPAGELAYVPPERRDAVHAEHAEGRTYELEDQLLCRDGRRLDVITSVRHVRDPRGGRPLRLVTFKDISARKETERGLRAEQALSSALRQILREPYLRTLDGVVIDVNDAFCELLGHPREVLVGMRRPYPFLATDGLDDAFAHAARLEADGTSQAELVFVHADGTRWLVHIVGVAVRDRDGVAIGWVQTARAIRPLSAIDAVRDQQGLPRPRGGRAPRAGAA